VKLSPQEKKHLSYLRDRRNDYGENDKASRKAIPLRKRLTARAFRRVSNHLLSKDRLKVTEAEAEDVEGKILVAKRKSQHQWKKVSDVPLGEYLARKRERRARRVPNGGTD
jgi:hypothetical protein